MTGEVQLIRSSLTDQQWHQMKERVDNPHLPGDLALSSSS